MKTKEILDKIDVWANKLGTTAEKLFEYYVKEARLYKLYFFINIIVFFVLSFISCIILSYGIPKESDRFGLIWEFQNYILTVVGSIFGVVAVCMLFYIIFNIETLVRSVKNTEYMAVEDLLANFND